MKSPTYLRLLLLVYCLLSVYPTNGYSAWADGQPDHVLVSEVAYYNQSQPGVNVYGEATIHKVYRTNPAVWPYLEYTLYNYYGSAFGWPFGGGPWQNIEGNLVYLTGGQYWQLVSGDWVNMPPVPPELQPTPTPTPTPSPDHFLDFTLTNNDTIARTWELRTSAGGESLGTLATGAVDGRVYLGFGEWGAPSIANLRFGPLQGGVTYEMWVNGQLVQSWTMPVEILDDYSGAYTISAPDPLASPTPTPSLATPTPAPTPTLTPAFPTPSPQYMASPPPVATPIPQPSGTPSVSVTHPDGTVTNFYTNPDGTVTRVNPDGSMSTNSAGTDWELRAGIDADAKAREKALADGITGMGGEGAAGGMVAQFGDPAPFQPRPTEVLVSGSQLPSFVPSISKGTGNATWSVGLFPQDWGSGDASSLLSSWGGVATNLFDWIKICIAWFILIWFFKFVNGEYVDPVFAQLRTPGIQGIDGGAVGGAVSVPSALIYLGIFVSVLVLTSFTWISFLAQFASLDLINAIPFGPGLGGAGGSATSLIQMVIFLVNQIFPLQFALSCLFNLVLLLTFKPAAHAFVVGVKSAFIR